MRAYGLPWCVTRMGSFRRRAFARYSENLFFASATLANRMGQPSGSHMARSIARILPSVHPPDASGLNILELFGAPSRSDHREQPESRHVNTTIGMDVSEFLEEFDRALEGLWDEELPTPRTRRKFEGNYHRSPCPCRRA